MVARVPLIVAGVMRCCVSPRWCERRCCCVVWWCGCYWVRSLLLLQSRGWSPVVVGGDLAVLRSSLGWFVPARCRVCLPWSLARLQQWTSPLRGAGVRKESPILGRLALGGVGVSACCQLCCVVCICTSWPYCGLFVSRGPLLVLPSGWRGWGTFAWVPLLLPCLAAAMVLHRAGSREHLRWQRSRRHLLLLSVLLGWRVSCLSLSLSLSLTLSLSLSPGHGALSLSSSTQPEGSAHVCPFSQSLALSLSLCRSRKPALSLCLSLCRCLSLSLSFCRSGRESEAKTVTIVYLCRLAAMVRSLDHTLSDVQHTSRSPPALALS